MNKTIILIFLSLLSVQIGSAQSERENLAIFIKSWGLARFRVSQDIANFKKVDSVGFYGISKLISNHSAGFLNQQIGKVTKEHESFNISEGNTEEQSNLQLELSWIENKKIKKKNKKALKTLVYYRPDSMPFAIRKHPEDLTWNLEYVLPISDDEIAKCVFGIGLLWNHIEFFFQKKHVLDVDWSDYLSYLLDHYLNDPNLQNYESTIVKMMGKIQDGHAHATSFSIMQSTGFFQLPIEIRTDESLSDPIVVKTFIIPHEDNQISIGDRIKSINNVSFSDFYNQNHIYFSGSEMIKIDKACSRYLMANSDVPLKVETKSGGIEYEKLITPLHIFDLDQVDESKFTDTIDIGFFGDSISYLNLSLIDSNDFSDYFHKVKHSDVLILDLRYYPNNLLDTIANYFFPDKTIISEYIQPNFNHPGYNENPKFDEIKPAGNNSFTGSIAVLVNHNTFSQGEYIALAISSLTNSYLIGSSTSGTDGNTIDFELPNKIRGSFTAIMINYPNSNPTFYKGLELDYSIPTQVIFQPDFDPELQYCLKIIQDQWDFWLRKKNLTNK